MSKKNSIGNGRTKRREQVKVELKEIYDVGAGRRNR
jgi:hypothetical protein